MAKLLGVLGGMGPAATADFLQKLVRSTSAKCDHDHIPTLTASVPQIPDRSNAILEQTASPLPALRDALSVLTRGGADCIVMPCNTAHYWYDQLLDGSGLEALHIVDAVVETLDLMDARPAKVGLLATTGTLAACIYPDRAPKRYNFLSPDQDSLEKLVMPGIRAIKAGDMDQARPLLTSAAERLFDAGASAIVLACTEIPLILDSSVDGRFVDATQALVGACLRRFGRVNAV